jgi:hypothetical protein
MTGAADATACIQAAIDAAFAGGYTVVRCPTNASMVTSGPIYQDPPGNLRVSLTPTIFNFSLTFISEGGAQHEGHGCRIQPNFNNQVAWWIGSGQAMILKGVEILSTPYLYRCSLPNTGVGVAISERATRTTIENVEVSGFYTGIWAGQQGVGQLADVNTYQKDYILNACYGIAMIDPEAYINTVIDNVIQAHISIYAPNNCTVHVFGGNYSPNTVASNAFSISGISAVTGASATGITFTATVASPDTYVGTPVYNTYTLVTSHYGVLPLTMTAWNATTGVGTFATTPIWGLYYYPSANPAATTDIQTEIQAATTIYASEMVTIFYGSSVSVNGAHIENPQAPTTLFNTQTAFQGKPGVNQASLKNAYLNWDPSLTGWSPYGTENPTPSQLAMYYAQSVNPFINIGNGDLQISNTAINSQGPLIADWSGSTPQYKLHIDNTDKLMLNIRMGTWPLANTINNPVIGGGEYDVSPFITQASTVADAYRTTGIGKSPFWGFRPASYTRPCVQPSQYTTISGTLPAITGTGNGNYAVSYPIIWGGQQYQICDW